jgi:O-succinylbenzoic acid--CoA ligase
MIDWSSAENHLLLNPRLPAGERETLERLAEAAPGLRRHLWVATSGTSGALKLVALSKAAVLSSAAAVNAHLDARPGDVWSRVLPSFHVGGLGIEARASLTGSRVEAFDWDPRRFAAGGFTLSSLVPAHVRDLVTAGLRSPRHLRAIVVGGGNLSDDLYSAGRELGWPLLPSYGLSEAASQVATATLESKELRILDHVQVRIDDGRIALSGPSLLTGYAQVDEGGNPVFLDPKVDGWFLTEDRGAVRGNVLSVYGRSGDFVKIGGESVDLIRLDRILDEVRYSIDAAIVAVPDERLGHVIHVATTEADPKNLVEAFNARVLPFERIRGIHRVDSIPRTPLGKLRRGELAEKVR